MVGQRKLNQTHPNPRFLSSDISIVFRNGTDRSPAVVAFRGPRNTLPSNSSSSSSEASPSLALGQATRKAWSLLLWNWSVS